jgi:hypothetical protein
MSCGRALSALTTLALACGPSPSPEDASRPDVSVLFATAAPAAVPSDRAPASTPTAAPAPTAACRTDDDCGYDPPGNRCGADPRYNKQPPLVDQGIVCYCDASTQGCALLRVDPAPCEGDTSCAVRIDPRPHPIRADAAHPYERPQPCRAPRAGAASRTVHWVTCERTNICTMHTRKCAQP